VVVDHQWRRNAQRESQDLRRRESPLLTFVVAPATVHSIATKTLLLVAHMAGAQDARPSFTSG